MMKKQQIPAEEARTWLMLPGRAQEDYAEAARDTAADALVIDLEDSVASAHKEEARRTLADWFRQGGTAWVRINEPRTAPGRADIDALRTLPGILGFVIPKAEELEDVTLVSEAADVPLIPLIETARGALRAEQLAAVPRVLRLGFGLGDFARDTGLRGRDAVAAVRVQITLASAAAGIAPAIDGGARGDDYDDLRAQAQEAAEFGFTGKFCLREEQVAPLRDALSPHAAEIEAAAALLADFERNGGAIENGDDLPHLTSARTLLRRTAALRILPPRTE